MACIPEDELRALLAANRLREAEELVERGAAQPDRAQSFREAGLLALKSGVPRLAAARAIGSITARPTLAMLMLRI